MDEQASDEKKKKEKRTDENDSRWKNVETR